MQRNEGKIDQAMRIVSGLLLIAIVFVGPGGSWAGVFALYLLVTGFLGFCPLYEALGVRTLGNVK